MARPTVALVSGDLLLSSRLRAALAGAAAVTTVRGSEMPTATTVFVDLNSDVEARITLIAAVRLRGGVRIIGFCQHDDRAIRVRAMAAGADQVVTNGALQEAAVRLIGGAATADA